MKFGRTTIFFSYSRADSKFALKLATSLRDAGINLWIDQLDIHPGLRWDAEVEKSLENSKSLLVILSEASVTSNNVLDEVSYALENNKQVFPVIIDNCKIPFRIKRLQYIDFTVDYDIAFDHLLKALNNAKPPDLIEAQQLNNIESKELNKEKETLKKIEEKEQAIKKINELKQTEKRPEILLFFNMKWNLILEVAVIITALSTRFTVPPSFEPQSLYDNQNYTSYSKFIVAGILGLSLVPCYFFNTRKFVWRWWSLAFIMLVAGIILNINYSNYKSRTVLDTGEFDYGRLVKGNNYLPEVRKLRETYKQSNGSYPTDKVLVAGFLGDHLQVWPKEKILYNTTSIIILYLGVLVCITLFIIFSIQALYCLDQPQKRIAAG